MGVVVNERSEVAVIVNINVIVAVAIAAAREGPTYDGPI